MPEHFAPNNLLWRIIMANDVYTFISYGDDNKDWDLFTKEIAFVEYNQSNQDGTAINQMMASLFPEHHKCDDVTYYDWDWDVTGDVLDTKWCHIHQVDEGSIELHSAWNAPTKLIKRISQTFGRYGLHIRIEDNDWGVIGDAKTHSLCGDDCFDCNKKSEHWQVKCLTATYYQKFVAALKGRYKSAKELLKDTTFYNDDCLDRYEAVSFINPVLFSDLEDVVCELSCSASNPKDLWKFNKDNLLNGLSDTTLKEALA